LPLFCQAVDGKPQDALFVYAQMLDAYARDTIEAQLLGCRVARFAVNELVAVSDQERVAETEEANRGSDLSHMSGIKLAQLPCGGPKLFQRNVGKLQVGSTSLRRRCAADARATRSWPSRRLRLFCLNWSPRVALDAIGSKELVIGILLFSLFKNNKSTRPG
jgi:hypothetical protein